MSIGSCHHCHKPVPATQADGTPARRGYDYKQVINDRRTVWHHFDPRFPDCYRAEAGDPKSPWYDDPRRYSLDEVQLTFEEIE